jgi:signal transduction histidine kinase
VGWQECKVSDAKPDLSHLGELAAGLGLHQHLCFIYETEEEQFAAALPFLRSGLERGEKCFFVADQNSGAAVVNALRKAGTDIDRHLRSGALILANKPDVRPGRFDPDWTIGFLSKSIQGDGDDRFSGVRTWLGEMTWALVEQTAPETLIEFEAKVNNFVRDHDVRALCQYRRERFSPELILGILRTHPVVVYGGLICNNPYYVPPEELLKPNQAAREVERLLNNIITREKSLAQLRALAARLQTAREDERSRAAREIHDELGQALTAIKLEFAALLQDLPAHDGPVRERSRSILELLDSTIRSVGRIATGLRPAILDDLGLVPALEWAAEDFQTRTGIRCQIDLPEADIALDPEHATAVFRIFQETLTNVVRHANATQVSMRLAEEDRGLILEVRDNGKGASEEQLSAGTSLGILGMRERVLLLGGTLTIKGAPGEGTVVRVSIPYSKQV